MHKWTLEEKKTISKHGSVRNRGRTKRGDNVNEFAHEHNLIIRNTLVQKQRKKRKDTGLVSQQMDK